MGAVSFERLNEVNRLVVVGSVDGTTAAAGYMRVLNNPKIKIDFTEAQRVGTLKPETWDANTKVGFIDLAVNNGGNNPEELTIKFVNAIKEAGHEIVFIADEHDSDKWEKVFIKCDLSFDLLVIKPKSRDERYPSSCSILQEAFEGHLDKTALELFDAGTQADLLQKGTPTRLSEIFKKAIKSDIRDDSRRDYLARHFSQNSDPDNKIKGWVEEYGIMESNLSIIMNSKEDLGNNIMRYRVGDLKHDATEFFKQAYATSPVVVLADTKAYFNNAFQPCVSIAVDDSKEGYKDLHVVNILKAVGICAGGFAAKANFAPQDMDAAIEAVQACVEKM